MPATYRRTHGIRYFHGCYSLGDDQLWGVVRRRKGGNHTLAALRRPVPSERADVRSSNPDGALYLARRSTFRHGSTPADWVIEMANLPPFKSPQGEAEYMAAYEASMRLWPLPYESADIRSRFGSTHVAVCGPEDAPPLVLLHCFLTSLTVWANNVADLSRNRRVHALDMMGQPGKSIPDQPIRNRAEMVEWLNSVLDYFEIRRADLVGYSYGGFAALNYAARAPDRVKALVILSPAGGLVPLKAQMYIRGALNTLTGAFLPGLTRYTMRSLFRWMFYKPNLRRAEIRPIADCIFNQMLLGTKHFHQEHLSPKNFVHPGICSDEELRAIWSPTLLLIGQQESLYNAAAAVTRARQLIPKIQAEIIPDAGHDLPVSKADMVDRKVLAFLGDYD